MLFAAGADFPATVLVNYTLLIGKPQPSIGTITSCFLNDLPPGRKSFVMKMQFSSWVYLLWPRIANSLLIISYSWEEEQGGVTVKRVDIQLSPLL